MTRLVLSLACAAVLAGMLPGIAWVFGVDLSRGDGSAVLCVLAYAAATAWFEVIAGGLYRIVRQL